MTETKASHAVSDEALDVLFRKARSYNAFLPGEISDQKLRELFDLMKWGPTTANSQPQRILFLRSQAAKDRLGPALSKTNLEKTIAAPVVAILAFDLKFYEHLGRMYHVPAARSWYETTPEHIHTTAFRNATLQGAYFIIAARALGLDAGRCRASTMPRWTRNSSRTGSGSRISSAFWARLTRPRTAAQPALRIRRSVQDFVVYASLRGTYCEEPVHSGALRGGRRPESRSVVANLPFGAASLAPQGDAESKVHD